MKNDYVKITLLAILAMLAFGLMVTVMSTVGTNNRIKLCREIGCPEVVNGTSATSE